MREPLKEPDEWKMPGPTTVAFGFDVLDRIEEAIMMVKERLRRAVTALDKPRGGPVSRGGPAARRRAPFAGAADWPPPG